VDKGPPLIHATSVQAAAMAINETFGGRESVAGSVPGRCFERVEASRMDRWLIEVVSLAFVTLIKSRLYPAALRSATNRNVPRWEHYSRTDYSSVSSRGNASSFVARHVRFATQPQHEFYSRVDLRSNCSVMSKRIAHRLYHHSRPAAAMRSKRHTSPGRHADSMR